MNKLLKAEPGQPANRPIEHTDGDHYIDEITGYKRDGKPFDFTAMEFHMQIGKEEGFEPEDAIFEIPNENFTISYDSRGDEAGVKNLLVIEIEDEFFKENGCYYHYVRLFDSQGRRFTFRGGEFIINN